jgi:hypothetical protein
MPTIEENVFSQASIWKDRPGFAPAHRALTRALNTHLSFKARRDEIAKDPNLSPAGRADKMRKHLAENMHELVRARKSVDVLKAKVAERRKSLLPPPLAKDDSVGAIRQMELRARIASMKVGERHRLLLSPNADMATLEAVISAPDYLSGLDEKGLDPNLRKIITERVIERRAPGTLADLEAWDDAITSVKVGADVVAMTAAEVGDFPSRHVFDAFVEASVGDSPRLDADVERSLEEAA